MKTDCLQKIPLQLKEAIESNGRWINTISVPCGKCARCIQRRKLEWGFRMENEMEYSKTAYFVTLTYAPETVPYNKYGQKTLIPTRAIDLKIAKQEQGRKRITKKWKAEQHDRSLQGFMKRLRQNQKRNWEKGIDSFLHRINKDDKIKFYAAGEYGEERGRPHYHLVIFNATEYNIRLSWTLGAIHILPANKQTIAYLMKYLDKQLGNEKVWKAEPEFNIMSEGIGNNYITKMKSWHKSNIDVLYVTNRNNVKIPMPKIYRLKIFDEQDRKDQIIIVNERLDENRNEIINMIGEEMYNYNQNQQAKEDTRRFKKKIKKRTID